jgi:FkbM family methyltransferase
MALASMFLFELREKHHVDDAVFLVDSGPWLQAALDRQGLRFQYERHGNRNSVERVFREVKRRTSSFSNTFSHVQPETAESWLQAFAVCHNALTKHRPVRGCPSKQARRPTGSRVPGQSPYMRMGRTFRSMQRVLRRMYAPFKPIAKRVGVHSEVVSGFRLGRNLLRRLKYVRHHQSFELGGLAARFRVRSRTEERALDNDWGNDPALVDMVDAVDADDVCYDVGAHLGVFSAFCGQVTDSAIVAVEAHPETARSLEDNLANNGVDATVFPLALSSTSGVVDLDVTDTTAGGAGRLSSESERETVEVATTTGAKLVEDHGLPEPTVVKIDVEGAEYDVITGMAELLRSNRCRLLYVEVHPEMLADSGHSEQELLELLEDIGFRVTERWEEYYSDPNYHIKAEA